MGCAEWVMIVLCFSQIKSSDRGSKFICMPCYRNAAGLKKYLDSHKTTTSLVSTNQKILESQAEGFLEDSDSDGEYGFGMGCSSKMVASGDKNLYFFEHEKCATEVTSMFFLWYYCTL